MLHSEDVHSTVCYDPAVGVWQYCKLEEQGMPLCLRSGCGHVKECFKHIPYSIPCSIPFHVLFFLHLTHLVHVGSTNKWYKCLSLQQ